MDFPTQSIQKKPYSIRPRQRGSKNCRTTDSVHLVSIGFLERKTDFLSVLKNAPTSIRSCRSSSHDQEIKTVFWQNKNGILAGPKVRLKPPYLLQSFFGFRLKFLSGRVIFVSCFPQRKNFTRDPSGETRRTGA